MTLAPAPLALGALCLVGCSALAAEPAGKPAPIRLFVEAEDFSIESGWQVVPWRENYFASTFAISFLSRMACLGAPEQLAVPALASLRVEVPRAGEYQLLARYEQPWAFSVEFDLEVEQNGRASRHVFGRLSDPKIWPLGGAAVPMKRHPWGGTDNIVWQRGGSLRLTAGQVRLRLRAGPQLSGDRARLRAARRNVDVIVLTDDHEGLEAQSKARYLPIDGWLVQDGDLFARFTNPRDAPSPVVPVVQAFAVGQHSPYSVHVRDWPRTTVVRGGRIVSGRDIVLAGPRGSAVAAHLVAPVLERPPELPLLPEDYLLPGQTSGWVPLGSVIDALNDSQWVPLALRPGQKAIDKAPVDLDIELAIPDGRGRLAPVRRLRVHGKPEYLSAATLVIPGNVRDRRQVRTQLEVIRDLLATVEGFPKRRPPRRFPVYGLLGFSRALQDPGDLGREATSLALALGSNTLTALSGPWAEPLGIPRRRTRIVTHWPLSRLDKGLADAKARGFADEIAIVSYGDETRIEPGRLPDYVAATRRLQEDLGPDVRTGMNYSPHANFLVDATHFVVPFREGALSLPWSEDFLWQVPEFSPQALGYLVSGLRAGAMARDLPIMMYVLPHSPGNTPRDFRLSWYLAVAHGARMLHLFCASPLAIAHTENYVSEQDVGMWRAIHDAVHDVGAFEDYVLDGRVRPARVGLLLSFEDERQTGDTNLKGGIHNQERKAVYYALRHAQVPVDFVAEDDFSEDRVGPFDLVYVTQQYLHSRTVTALTRFAERGGTVVALAGGGFLDENGQKNPATGRLYGVADQSLFKDPALPMILAKQDLPGLEPLDHARLGDLDIGALVWKQAILPSDGRVVGRFRDGTAAVVEKAHGKGRAVLFGFFPGMAYLQSGLPLRPVDRAATDAGFNHFLPTDMDARIRRAVVDDFLPTGFVRPVETSEPLVEATLIETKMPRRLAVPLMNYTGKPVASLKVTLRGLGSWSRVRSVERGDLSIVADGGIATVALPLDVADMLLFDGER